MIKHPIVGIPQKNKVLIRPIDAAVMPPARDPKMCPIISRDALNEEDTWFVLVILLFYFHLPIHEASSNVAEISSVP